MLMNRTFFLACATVVTLGIATASSTPAHARPCSKADSEREKRSCLIRSVIYNVEAAVSEAAATSAKPKSSKGASTAKPTEDPNTTKPTTPTAETKPNAASSPATCGLTKEYVTGAVKFRDTCTGEWAQRDIM